jgi:hypothetical protein
LTIPVNHVIDQFVAVLLILLVPAHVVLVHAFFRGLDPQKLEVPCQSSFTLISHILLLLCPF